MKNIQVVEKNEMKDFFSNFWNTEEFKNLQKSHPFFQAFIKKLGKSPIFFFDLSHENGRYHLSSHLRFIARREYENKYIQDLYYFHELLHCAEFEPSEDDSYSNWKDKLNENELYASIVSEVLVYYMQPNLVGKTFSPLWAEKFLSEDQKSHVSPGKMGLYEGDLTFDPMSFRNLQEWPQSVQRVVARRNELRDVQSEDDVTEAAEKFIVKYNKARTRWIEKWKPHYLRIDELLMSLHQEEITGQEYLDLVMENCDASGRAFYPA